MRKIFVISVLAWIVSACNSTATNFVTGVDPNNGSGPNSIISPLPATGPIALKVSQGNQLSKGSSLAGLRVGYLIARPELVAGLTKVKDSYNCDTLSLLGGAAALDDSDHLAGTRSKILRTRERLAQAMRGLGYGVPESQANFVWCQGGPAARGVYDALKARNLLVRLMSYAGRDDGLRITVGTDAEIDALLVAMGSIVGGMGD